MQLLTSKAARWTAAWAVLASMVVGCPPQRDNSYEDLNQPESKPLPPPKPIDPTTVDTRDDVIRIIPYWSQVPWLKSSDVVVGFGVRVYFVSGETEVGTFVPGQIQILTNLLTPEGDYLRRSLVHQKTIVGQEEVGFRVRRKSPIGYSYGFPVRWPDDLNLAGKQIEVLIRYVRTNGTTIDSASKRLRVPLSSAAPKIIDSEPS
jgi:hypothetical protein